MRHKVLLSVILIISCFCVVMLSGCGFKVEYHDIEIYKNKSYLNDDFIENHKTANPKSLKSAYENADKFFPNNEDIEYDYSKLDFYAYHKFGDDEISTVVLDMYFDNEDSYNYAVQQEISNYTFISEDTKLDKYIKGKRIYEYQIGDFVGKIIENPPNYSFPYCFRSIFYNDKDKVLRCLYVSRYLENKMPTVELFKNNTNCPWEALN